jgi:predicted O-methyltransferase YrrM
MDDDVQGPDDWIPRTGRSLGHPGWGLIYHLVLCHLDPDQPNLILETGTNVGSTAIVMAQAIKDSGRPGIVRTVEIDTAIADEAARRIELAGLAAYVECFKGDSLATLPVMLRGGPPLRIAFLDGNHFHDHVVAEFDAVEGHLAHDGVVLFDNTYAIAEDDEDPRVHGALKTILRKYGGNLLNLPYCSWYTPGIALWQRSAFENMDPPTPNSFVSNKSG